jgi:hypothetical protein
MASSPLPLVDGSAPPPMQAKEKQEKALDAGELVRRSVV